eukprot:TRINITY_DN7800_c0_g1_i1.p1 TRINITY_DN7800_c0_g1~~TRINITY_DN7800_c0_g1_i1.p1  ORF type:complete len:693 (-),score=67.90 TRINITY_DN7800_c0_g1_i1:6-2084(-)
MMETRSRKHRYSRCATMQALTCSAGRPQGGRRSFSRAHWGRILRLVSLLALRCPLRGDLRFSARTLLAAPTLCRTTLFLLQCPALGISPFHWVEIGMTPSRNAPWHSDPVWKSNADVLACEDCGIAFSLAVRRHHCRSCGGIFCRECSPVRAPLRIFGHPGMARICNPCVVKLQRIVWRMEEGRRTVQEEEWHARQEVLRSEGIVREEARRRLGLLLREVTTFATISQWEVRCRTDVAFDASPRGPQSRGVPDDPGSPNPHSACPSPTNAVGCNEGLAPNRFGFFGRGDCCASARTVPIKSVLAALDEWRRLADSSTWRSNRGRFAAQSLMERLSTLALRGIPTECRMRLWQEMSGVTAVRRRHAGTYERLLDLPVPSEVQAIVAADLSRTLFDHILFCEGMPKFSALQRLLFAFAVSHPGVSYVQGMSFLAATLLLYFPEEDAFWLFVVIMHRFGLIALFRDDCVGLSALCSTLSEILPAEVNAHLSYHCVPIATYAASWFLTFFVSSFQCWPTVLAIWDLLWITSAPSSLENLENEHFGHITAITGQVIDPEDTEKKTRYQYACHGPLYLLRIAEALHTKFQTEIMGCSSIMQLMLLLQKQLPNEAVHLRTLQQALLGTERLLSSAILHPRIPLSSSFMAFLCGKQRQTQAVAGTRSLSLKPARANNLTVEPDEPAAGSVVSTFALLHRM